MPDMAADLSPEWLSCLPSSWSYGVTRDGRVFFINEQGKSTTWLHPVTGEAVITGHRKTPDLPTGWEEGFTFEGARCFINHNERKVTCKHPVSGQPSQDNCIFVVNEHPASKMQSHEKKDRPVSAINEVSNCTMASECGTHPGSPLARASRSLKKIHNFGKRSNSIKRNPNAPVQKRNWLYKQDSTGMKLWKKRWFVLSDMCLFYYRDEKEEGILGSILLPSFHISMLSVDDHINRKYAFKATHPNMRTYYFCTDAAKEMESWMKVMTDAALVHSEPVKRIEKLKPEHSAPQEVNSIENHRMLTRPEALNNERNREVGRLEETTELKDAEKYGFQKEGIERPLTKINSVKVHPASREKETTTAAGSVQGGQYIPAQVNGAGERAGNISPADKGITPGQRQQQQPQYHEPERALQRTSSMMQLEQWVRTHRVRGQEDETRSITSYQTLPRNMPSYRAQIVPHYPEAYRTLPRNSVARPDSICSISASVYDRALGPVSTEDKRRSMRDDTMWQLYEWQQRQAYTKQGPIGSYGTLSSPKTMINISDHVTHSIPPSPSHGSLALYQGYSPLGLYNVGSGSEVSSPVFRGDRRHRTQHAKYAYPPDRRSMPAGPPLQPISPQVLQGKTISHGEFRDPAYNYRTEELNIDAKLSRLCEQDKLVRTQEEKLQQLHREKHTLEQALLSASQEIEMNADNPAAIQGVIQQRDVLQNGLLSTCRERSRANAELERSWMEYDRLESDVTLAKNNLQEQLEKLGDQSSSLHHANIQKELWRIQDVIEALAKNRPQRNSEDTGFSKPISDKHKSEGPDYRLYKSEPELTTVAEVDESNGEEKTDTAAEKESSSVKGSSYPVGVVSPRTKPPTPQSSTIASYVTLRKTKKLDTRMERPRSAVEQLCLTESSRPRMSVEEQMERMKRHQQASLREKKKGLNIIGSHENLPSRSPSFYKENPFKSAQLCKMEDAMSSNIEELEASLQGDGLERNHETPAQEIARLKGAGQPGERSVDKELFTPGKVLIPERYIESDPEEVLSPEESADKQKKVDRIKAILAKNSMQNAVAVVNHKTEDHTEEEANAQEQEKILNISYELAAEASKRSKLVAVKSLSSPPQSPTSPSSPPHPPLAEGSHFMCV
ncbi:pleckstrin homology domain-containing family A member 5-like isoform X11 [Polyodon spathula]|uniref:pleckstrin homology domain-containing family A member 5-like isoform X11 n=1 Tax=Polyodon spathula TaxID=7913 RepID=UPI001B7DB991|nr:pleckstrin homology domain-containing family A member 5-like isoform X11 [Polyodon spathula]